MIIVACSVAPIFESFFLVMTILVFKKSSFTPVFYLPIISFVAMTMHIEGKDDLMSLPVQFIAFFIYAWYVDNRKNIFLLLFVGLKLL